MSEKTTNLDELFDKSVMESANYYDVVYEDLQPAEEYSARHAIRNFIYMHGHRLENKIAHMEPIEVWIIAYSQSGAFKDREELARVRVRLSLTIEKLPDETKEGTNP